MSTSFKEMQKTKFSVPKQSIEIDFHDWDEIVNNTFPWLDGRYEIVADEELNNGQIYEIDPRESEIDYRALQRFLNGETLFNTRFIADLLLTIGIIPKGFKILVNIYW